MKLAFNSYPSKDLDRFGNKSYPMILPVYEDESLFIENIQPIADFEGKPGQVHAVRNEDRTILIIVGMGKRKEVSRDIINEAGKAAAKILPTLHEFSGKAGLYVHGDETALSESQLSAFFTDALIRHSYAFDKYKSEKPKKLTDLVVLTENPQLTEKFYSPLKAVTNGAFFAADLANEPPNVLTPPAYAARIQDDFAGTSVNVSILDEHDLKNLKAGGILAVGQGSAAPPRLVVLEYDGTSDPNAQPLALVGKGITFDTGGYSIKPSAGMDAMKFDMAGSAAVIGAMKALAGRKAPVKVVAVVALAENMVSGNAYRPADIIHMMSGKTVEITNTDAEGRLVLADALTYVQQKFNPHTIIDLATLTGACVAALGNDFAGIFTNSDKLHTQLVKSGKEAGENGWRLPLHKSFNEAMKGTVADYQNADMKSGPGASKAAAFLQEFVDKSRKWAHLDIAGPGIPKNGIAHGYGVRWLNTLIEKYFEKKPGASQLKPAPAPQ